MNPALFNWMKETLNRLFIDKPAYFKYWQWLSMFLLVISGIPYTLNQFNIHLPEPWSTFESKAVSWAAFAMLIMSQLTVKTPPVGQTSEGQAITVLDKTKLPFTQKTEAKEVKDKVPPLEVIPEVPEKPEEDPEDK